MDFLKRKLILTYSAVFLIILDNIDAGSLVIDDCIKQLETAGYKSSNDGLTNYAERIFDIYFEADHTVDEFHQDIAITEYDNCEKNQWEEGETHVDHLEKYYRCYLLMYIRSMPFKLNTVIEWCKEKSGANIQMEHTCRRELLADGFKFFDGIDNYAFYLRIKRNNELDELKTWSQEYAAYLEEEGADIEAFDTESMDTLQNTKSWIEAFDTEIELYKAGFKDRYHGLPNFQNTVEKIYKFKCDSLRGKPKIYCEFLLQKFLEYDANDLRPLLVDPGTHIWCEYFDQYKDEDDVDIMERLLGTSILKQIELSDCVAALQRLDILAEHDPMTSFVKKSYERFYKNHPSSPVETIAKKIESSFILCTLIQWINIGLPKDLLEKYYTCYLIVYTRHLTENIKNSEKWCEQKYSDEEPGDATTTLISTCKNDLRTDKLNFPHGIDSYTYLSWIEGDVKLRETFKDNTKEYNEYLKEEVLEIPYQFEDSTTWCQHFQCDVELRNAGFHDRYNGGRNYHKKVVEKFENDCSKLQGKEAKIYCSDLKSVYGGSDPNAELKPLLNNPGTMVWCRKHYPIA